MAVPDMRLDAAEIRRRMSELAAFASRLEAQGAGWEDDSGWKANEAWVEYDQLKAALDAQSRRDAIASGSSHR